MASTGGDIGSGALTGAGAGAAIGSVVPGMGTLIGAGIGTVVGVLGSIGKWFFNKNEAKRKKKEADRLVEQQKTRHKEFLAEADKRTGELYEKYKANPEEIKQQYGESVKRALDQQAGGMVAALSSQRRVNPALAANLLANQQADIQAKAAGDTALAQTKLGTEFDIYNTKLMQQIRQQELTYEGKEENRQAGYAEDSLKQQQELRQKMVDEMFSDIASNIESVTTLSGLGKNKTSPNVKNLSLGGDSPYSKKLQNPWDRYSLLDNPSNTYKGTLG